MDWAGQLRVLEAGRISPRAELGPWTCDAEHHSDSGHRAGASDLAARGARQRSQDRAARIGCGENVVDSNWNACGWNCGRSDLLQLLDRLSLMIAELTGAGAAQIPFIRHPNSFTKRNSRAPTKFLQSADV